MHMGFLPAYLLHHLIHLIIVSDASPSIFDIIDLTHLPDSPVPHCFEVQVGDIILYFHGVWGGMFDLEWSIVCSASEEDGIVLEGFSFIGVNTGVQVLRPFSTKTAKNNIPYCTVTVKNAINSETFA